MAPDIRSHLHILLGKGLRMTARRWRRRWEAQGLVEYSLILLLIAIAAVVALGTIGPGLDALYQRVAGSFPAI